MRASHKTIAPATFSSCIKDLLFNKLINKTDAEKGKKVYYSLTNKGKQHIKFLLKGYGRQSKGVFGEEEKRLRSLYLLIFLFRRPPAYTFGSEEEFVALLSKNNLSVKDLTRLTKREENKEDKTIITTTFESESGFFVWKVETLNKRNISEERSYVYTCTIPGLSITDILEARNKPAFWHINFTKPEVQDAVEFLRYEGMLRPIAFSPNGEERYDVNDPSVKIFLEDCWELYGIVFFLTDLIWKKIRAPTTDEKKWVEQHHGTLAANKILQNTSIERYKHFKKIKNKKLYLRRAWPTIIDHNDEIKKALEHLKKKHANVIEKYQFPFDDLLELIYPNCLQQLAAPIK
jgi:DNA-binding PadR family transcriptional regulator